ncbi:tmk [Bdellovibrio bacteriovorus HD100]|uniref:Thymidylate kinase n=2 Tax=Bdellovibrio bacteriovorus TaxID=959 RepID=KTHY_BDEBA|nr:RecName: Full=Thymidylate kinase; AltName: Full=dTMP kinase [Bdellovibrio bacteriovorus HD100]CAE78970.1 tmk [Bdellovibrio bacteriovorus HD100]
MRCKMKFIVFEGLDGSGKSSLMAALERELQNRAINFLRTREPGGTPLGDEIRNMILRKEGPAPTPRTELLLYEASRSQHVDQVIRPALAAGTWVLCDRFAASSVAFQSGGRAISEADVVMLNTFATGGLKADITVLLDLSVEESRRRRQGRGAVTGETEDRIESEADTFHENVRQSFLKQSREDAAAWIVLDARETPEVLFKQLLQSLTERKVL